METDTSEIYKTARQTLEMCEVKPSENVVVYTDTLQDPALVEAFHDACRDLGCDVILVRSLHHFPETDPAQPAVAALKAADMVLDLTSESWFYAPSTPAILKSGTRILLFVDVLPENLVRRPPDREVNARAQKAAEMMNGAQEFRLTTPEGTDFTCRRGSRVASAQKGFVSRPGEIDLYSNSTISFAPPETEAEGILFLNGPQILSPQHKYVVEKPVRLEINKGRIVDIDASHEDGRIFKQWIEQFEDPNMYTIAHFGFSLDQRARNLSRFDLSEWESLYGSVMVAFGANDEPSLGGANRAKGHSDSVLLNASLYMDGTPVIIEGEFTKASGLRAPQS